MRTMDHETLKLIMDTAVKASGAEGKAAVIKLPGEPSHVYATVDSEGCIERHVVDPAPRSHTLNRISDIPRFLGNVRENIEAKPSVWIAEAGVTIVLSDTAETNKLGKAFCPLQTTTQLQTLRQLATGLRQKQRPFSTMLRTTFYDAIQEGDGDARQLMQAVKVIDWKNSSSGRSTAEHGRESLGREIKSEIVAENGGLPEFCVFRFPVFNDPDFRQLKPFRCAVDVDPNDQTFALQVMANSIEYAIFAALEEIRVYLLTAIGDVEEGQRETPIYFGTP